MKKVIVSLFLAGLVATAAAHPFETQDASTNGGGRWSADAVFGMSRLAAKEQNLSIHGLEVHYGIIDRLDVGISLLNLDGETGDVKWRPLEIYAKLALITDMLAIGAEMPLKFTSNHVNDKFDIDLRAIVEVMMFRGNLGFGALDDSGEFKYGLGIVPSIGPAYVGAEFTGTGSGDYGWGIGGGVDIRALEVSLGFGGGFESNEDLKWSLGVSVRFGGR